MTRRYNSKIFYIGISVFSIFSLIALLAIGTSNKEKILTGPVHPDPVLPDPVLPDPVLPDPVLPDPVLPDPVLPDPVLPDPFLPDPVLPDPVSAPQDFESDFLDTLSSPPQYRKLSESVGMINRGNFCYANSALQTIFRIPAINKIVMNWNVYRTKLDTKLDKLRQTLESQKENESQRSSDILDQILRLLDDNIISHKGRPEENSLINLKYNLQLLKEIEAYHRSLKHLSDTCIKEKLSTDIIKPMVNNSKEVADKLIEKLNISKSYDYGADEKENSTAIYRINSNIEDLSMCSKDLDKYLQLSNLNDIISAYRKVSKLKIIDFFAVIDTQSSTLLDMIYGEFRVDLNSWVSLENALIETEKTEIEINSIETTIRVMTGLQAIFNQLQNNMIGSPVSWKAAEDLALPGKFIIDSQEDSAEYFDTIFSNILEVIPKSQYHHIRPKIEVSSTFEGYEHIANDEKNFIYLNLRTNNFGTALKELLGPKIEDGMTTTMKLASFPKIIPFQLARFNEDGSEKITKKFPMPLDFDFREYSINPSIPRPYRLKMVICHQGNRPRSGHYYSFVREVNDWYSLNDKEINLITDDNRNGLLDFMEEGYIYFYERIDTDSE